jgi:hypothetical protein
MRARCSQVTCSYGSSDLTVLLHASAIRLCGLTLTIDYPTCEVGVIGFSGLYAMFGRIELSSEFADCNSISSKSFDILSLVSLCPERFGNAIFPRTRSVALHRECCAEAGPAKSSPAHHPAALQLQVRVGQMAHSDQKYL